ncbi:MAG: rod shape-determining protein MreC [Alphaproteobacteria bacterium]|nr:rod shape-determining protein MreC [Alphaproteobacteria bacterium]
MAQDIIAPKRKIRRLRGSYISPFTQVIQRFIFAFMVIASIILMLLGKNDNILIERMKISVDATLAPVFTVLLYPIRTIEDFVLTIQEIGNLRQEVTRLRAEQAQLLQWQAVARQLEAENTSLRNLTHMPAEPAISFATGRVIGNYTGSFSHNVLVNIGEQQNISKGQIALTGDGLAGRVLEVSSHTSRVVLITDSSSRIPVINERTREKAILVGDNSDLPKIIYIQPDSFPQIGDRIVTSGDGGVFLPGMQIGIVTQLVGSGALVQPFVDLDRLEYLRLIRYNIPGLNELPPQKNSTP